HVRVGVVGQHIAGRWRAARAVGNTAFSVALAVSATAVGTVSDVVVTTILKVSLAARPPRSVAVTLTANVPASPLVGVPLNVPVAALKRSQAGGAEPSAAVAV